MSCVLLYAQEGNLGRTLIEESLALLAPVKVIHTLEGAGSKKKKNVATPGFVFDGHFKTDDPDGGPCAPSVFGCPDVLGCQLLG
jgi:hypothetical protein